MKISFLIAVLFLVLSCSDKKYNPKKNLTIVSYNVENLFDLIDEEAKQDEEFTPDGNKHWTQGRYNKKLSDLSQVLSAINGQELPEIIGLCEVENKKVVEDLFKNGEFDPKNYGIVHYESPDFRGIDCALAYNTAEVEVVKSEPIHVSFPDEPDYFTRDVLYVKAKMSNKEIFHFFVNHWPSRIGGNEKTEPNRIFVASLVKAKTDSILTENPNANIVIMGDMNDEPGNKSIMGTLQASLEIDANSQLINMMAPAYEEGKGTYNFRGDWNMLDNIIVSRSLFDGKGFDCVDKKGHVFSQDWMEYTNQNGQVSPNRTYGGPNYYGGISDHFPVYIRLSR